MAAVDGVCFVFPGDLTSPSGGTRRVRQFSRSLAAAGTDVTIVTTKQEDPPSIHENVTVREIPLSNEGLGNQLQRAILLSLAAHRTNPDVRARTVFVHSTLSGIASLLGWTRRGYVLDMHDLASQSPLYRDLPLAGLVQRVVGYFERRGIARAEEVVVVSPVMRSFLVEEWDVDPETITTIPNAHLPGLERHRVPAAERVAGRVAFLGTLHPKLDVEAFASLARLDSVSEVLVIGDGPKREQVEAIGDDAVRVLGTLPDEEAFPKIAAAEVAINPQHDSWLQRASSPVKLHDYAALGVPIVATEGPAEVAALEETGAAVAVPANTSDFVEAVDEVLADEDRRRSMAGAAHEFSAGNSWDARAAEFVELIDQ